MFTSTMTRTFPRQNRKLTLTPTFIAALLPFSTNRFVARTLFTSYDEILIPFFEHYLNPTQVRAIEHLVVEKHREATKTGRHPSSDV